MEPMSDKVLANKPAVAIIGGGPAGMSCALWLKHLGFSPSIIERNAELGGQLLQFNRINRWVLGWPGRTSVELAKSYADHIIEESIPVFFNASVKAVNYTEKLGFSITVETASQSSTMTVNAIVLASGLQARSIEIFRQSPELQFLFAKGLIGCHPLDHLEPLKSLEGKTVAVIGGGDNAHFTARDLATVTARTYLLVRSRPQAQKTIRTEVDDLVAQGLVVEYLETEVNSFHQNPNGIKLVLKRLGLANQTIIVNRVFVRTGFTPNSQFLATLGPLAHINRLKHGYFRTDSWKRTSMDKVYAIGDVASPRMQSVVTAIADGAIAARAIANEISFND